MKRALSLALTVILLSGCGNKDVHIAKVIDLRNDILSCNSCNFTSDITADYGDSIYSFTMECKWSSKGDMELEIIHPESISGITAHIEEGTGQLIFGDNALFFELVADEQISPISAAWILMEALCEGYVCTCGNQNGCIFVQINDSFAGSQFTADVWMNEDRVPDKAEIVWQGRRILTIDIDDFEIV